MVIVIGDMIADFTLRIPAFPIGAGGLQPVEYLALGPGGAGNVAITAARLGLHVACLGEVGSDRFGEIVLEGLRAEGVDVGDVIVSRGGETPVAGVIVDQRGEPAYLGYPGRLVVHALPEPWEAKISGAEAVFADGWADHAHVPDLILGSMRAAKHSSVPFFFDPGPGNPALDGRWHVDACALATVLLATEDEAERLAGVSDPVAAARQLMELGPEMVVVKRGAAGCFLVRGAEVHLAPGLPVEALDNTGAGDSLDAAVIFGYLKGLSLEAMGVLANATGAAKVRKLGTGRNMPRLAEIREMLDRFDPDMSSLIGRAVSP